MNWVRRLTPVVFVFSVLAVIYWVAYLPAKVRQNTLKNEVASLDVDIANLQFRIKGMSDQGPEQVFPDELLWVSESKTDAEIGFQDAVVRLAEEFGLTLISFGASGLTRGTTQDMMAFECEVEGPLGKTHAFLAALEELSPKTATGILRMRPAQIYGDQPINDVLIYSQITLWAFWGVVP